MNGERDNCREVLATLYLYLDGEISGLSCVEIETHIERCVPCAKRLGFERELKTMLALRCRGRAPAELLDRIRAMLESS